MNELNYKFEVLKPEEQIESVSTPQMIVYRTSDNQLRVDIYFMLNSAYSITGGTVKSALGKVKLQYTVESPSGAVCASVAPSKIAFTFDDPEGMATNFEFAGQKI